MDPSVSTLLLKLWWHDATSVIAANREIVTLNCSYYCGYNVVLRLDLWKKCVRQAKTALTYKQEQFNIFNTLENKTKA